MHLMHIYALKIIHDDMNENEMCVNECMIYKNVF